MGFHRVDTSKLVRGAGRLMYAPSTTTKPAKLVDVIVLTAGTTQYNPQTTWVDLGATREGIQIAINNSEDAFEVDQVQGEVGSAPNAWEVSLATRLAEFTLENFVIIWEGAAITTDTTVTPNERETGFAGATSYTERRMAVLFQKPSGLIQGYFFYRMVRAPQEGVIDFRKGGDAISIPVRWKSLADSTVSDPKKQHFIIREQVSP